MKSEDIQKLHSESLQLRNQQFQIVTIALASTGISAWLIPAISSGGPDDKVIMIATFSWIFLLGIFFAWSLSLKRMIDIIAEYLKLNNLSDWEINFKQFHESSNKSSVLHFGQTKFSFIIFLTYGIIVTASGVNAVSTDYKIILILIGFVYVVACFLMFGFNSRPVVIENKWKEILEKNK